MTFLSLLSLELECALNNLSLRAVNTQKRATKATRSATTTLCTWVRRIRVLHAAISRPGRSILHIIGSRGIDTQRNPGHDPVRERLAKLDIPRNGIDSGRLVREHPVLGIRLDGVGVRRVRVNQVRIVNQILIEKDLPDMVDGARAPQQRAVGQLRGVLVDNHVGVGGAGRVVAREGELDLDDTFVVCGPDGAGKGRVEDAWVRSVAIVDVVGARVDTCLVGLPELGPLVGHGLAGVDVDDLHV